LATTNVDESLVESMPAEMDRAVFCSILSQAAKPDLCGIPGGAARSTAIPMRGSIAVAALVSSAELKQQALSTSASTPSPAR